MTGVVSADEGRWRGGRDYHRDICDEYVPSSSWSFERVVHDGDAVDVAAAHRDA